MRYIDLRSDTVTVPTDEMRKAMACAEVGDDAYGDDPTVKRLEIMAAERVGKEAALFVPTGTFGNQLAIFTHTTRGQEIIAGRDNHVVLHEIGSSAVIAGVQIRTVSTCGGEICTAEVEMAIQKGGPYDMGTGLICIENAHGCGKVVSIDNMREVYTIAKKYQVPVHLDGARIFNAAAHLKVNALDIAKFCDSVMFCLSKGLSAPVGSILAGSSEFIRVAKTKRKLMGGAMRQAGIIAAAGIVALEKMVDRLLEDHDNAIYLAEGLSRIPDIHVEFNRCDINMVFIRADGVYADEYRLKSYLYEHNIKITGLRNNEYRLVTHVGLDKRDLDYVIECMYNFSTLA